MPKSKTGGRQKGTPNKRSLQAIQLSVDLDVDPLKILLYFAKGDWESLGLKEYETRLTKSGETIEIQTITADMRLSAAKDAARFVYPQLKAVELSADTGEEDGAQITGIKIDLEERKRSIKGEK